MEEEGLAAMMSSQPLGGGQPTMQDIEQIVQLLQQGISPEEIIAMGVPESLIQQAIAMLQNAEQNARPQIDEQNQGLGGMLAAR